MLYLVKKDFLLVKKVMLTTLLLIVLIPVLVPFIAPDTPSLLPFLYMLVIGALMLLQTIAAQEENSPKAGALLCAAGYSRNQFVWAKYVSFILLYLYCLVAFTLVSLFQGDSFALQPADFLFALLVGVGVFGVNMPVVLRYGMMQARYIFIVVILLLSLGPNLLVKLVGDKSLDFSFSPVMTQSVTAAIFGVAAIVLFFLSMVISMGIYNKKEL